MRTRRPGGLVDQARRVCFLPILWTSRDVGRQIGWWRPSLSHWRRRVRWRLCSDDCSPPRWCRRRLQRQYPRNWKGCYGDCWEIAPKPAPPAKSGIANLETLLQGLLPGSLTPALQTRPCPIRWDWATIVCFSCGKAGHGVGQYPKLNETFPFMLPGWTAEKVGDSFVMMSP